MFRKIKIVLEKLFNKIVHVSSVEELEEQKKLMKATLDKVQENKNNTKAELKIEQEKLSEAQYDLKCLERKIEEYIKDNDMKKAKEGYQYKLQLEKDINRSKRNISAFNSMVSSIQNQINIYKSKIDQIDNNIDELKAKEKFTETAKQFRNDMNSLECKDIKDITSEINKAFYSEKFALKDIQKQDDKSINKYIQKDQMSFDEYVEKIKNKNTKEDK